MDKSPEQVKQDKQVAEYTKLVTDAVDIIGLLGHQPTLKMIRQAWLNQELTHPELNLVLTKLSQDLEGDEESFKDHTSVYRHMFGGVGLGKSTKLNPVTLSVAEQVAAVVNIIPPKKERITNDSPAYEEVHSTSRKKKIEVINKDAIPAHLQYLL